MTKNLKHLLAIQSFFLLFISCLNSASAKDVKDQVMKETDLDERIVLFCLEYCQGNERKGYLKSLTVNRMDNGKYYVVGRGALRNRHVVRSPYEMVLFDHTVLVNAFGTLDPDSCELRVDEAFIQNDYRNIFSSLLKNHTDIIGRVEKVPDCRRFIN